MPKLLYDRQPSDSAEEHKIRKLARSRHDPEFVPKGRGQSAFKTMTLPV